MIEWTMSVSSVLDYIKMVFFFFVQVLGGTYSVESTRILPITRWVFVDRYTGTYTYRYMTNIRLYVHHGSVIAYIYCYAILLENLVSLLPVEKKIYYNTGPFAHFYTHESHE